MQKVWHLVCSNTAKDCEIELFLISDSGKQKFIASFRLICKLYSTLLLLSLLIITQIYQTNDTTNKVTISVYFSSAAYIWKHKQLKI